MEKPTIFVTGGSGFIGRNIVEYFQDGATILAPTHKELDLFSREDVGEFFKNNEVDFVINCANVGGDRKSCGVTDVVEKNLRIFFNLYDHNIYFKRMIHFGSGAEYDKSRALHQVYEGDTWLHTPKDSYGFSKYIISGTINDEYDDVVCLRLFGVFGKYEDYTFKFISNSIVKYLLGLPIHIHQNVLFDWLYVRDLVEILPDFLYSPRLTSSTYNITPGSPLDLLSIAELINTPQKVEIVVENPGLGNEYTGSNSRLTKFRKHTYFTPMQRAILELKDYYQSILPTIDPEVIKRDDLRKYCQVKAGEP